METWAVHIKFTTARGDLCHFDAVVPAIGAEAAREEAIRQLGRRRKGFTVDQTTARENRERAA